MYKSAIEPSRLAWMASGKPARNGSYSKAVLKRYMATHCALLAAKEFGSRLIHPVKTHRLFTSQVGETVLRSRSAFVGGIQIKVGDVCLGSVPCIVKDCLKMQSTSVLHFLVCVLRLKEDKGLFSFWYVTTDFRTVPETALGERPTWWSQDDDYLTCLT